MSGPHLSLQPYFKPLTPTCCMWASLIFCYHNTPPPTTGPFYRLFPLPETFPLCLINFSSFRCQLNHYFLKNLFLIPIPIDLIPYYVHMCICDSLITLCLFHQTTIKGKDSVLFITFSSVPITVPGAL